MKDSTKKEIKDILKYFDTKFLFFGSQKTQNHYRKFLKKSLHSIATKSAEEERTRILEALPEEHDTYPSSEVKEWKDKTKCLDYYNKAISQIKSIIKKQ